MVFPFTKFKVNSQSNSDDCPQEPVAPHALLGLLEGRAGGLQHLEAEESDGLAGLAGGL